MSASNRKSRLIGRRAARAFLSCLTGVPLGAVALAATPRALHAQSRIEGPLVLRLPVSARQLGMGNAGVAGNDADVLLVNPGMLSGARGLAASVQSYGRHATAGSMATVTTSGSLTVAVGAQFLDYQAPGTRYDDAVRFGATHLSDGGTVPATSSAFTLGLARTVKGLRLGAAVKYAEDRVGSAQGGAAAVDLGFTMPMGPGSLGVVVQNVGGDVHVGDRRGVLPTRLGIGYGGGPFPVSDHLDLGAQMALTVERDGFVRPAGGVELGFVPIEGVQIALRNGLRLPRERDEPLVTAGLGVTVDRVSVDYAMEPMRGGRPVAHRLGLRIK